MKLHQWYNLLSGYQLVRLDLADGIGGFGTYKVKDLPYQFDDCTVRNFGMNDHGDMWFEIYAPGEEADA